MAHKYTPAPTARTAGGISPAEWVEHFTILADFDGSEVKTRVTRLLSDGTEVVDFVPRKRTALVLTNPVKQHNTHFYEWDVCPDRVSLDAACRYQADPVQWVDLVDTRIKKVACIVPLGGLKAGDAKSHRVWLQAAVEYLSEGGYGIKASDANVANMLSSLLKSIILALAKSEELTVQLKYFDLAIDLVRAINSYQLNEPQTAQASETGETGKVVFKVFESLRLALRTDDTMQKFNAYIFGEPMPIKDLWNNVGIILTRGIGRGQQSVMDNYAGCVGCIVIPALLRTIVQGSTGAGGETSESCQHKLNQFLVTYATKSIELKATGASGSAINLQLLPMLFDAAGIVYTRKQIEQLDAFCRKPSNSKRELPLSEWGISTISSTSSSSAISSSSSFVRAPATSSSSSSSSSSISTATVPLGLSFPCITKGIRGGSPATITPLAAFPAPSSVEVKDQKLVTKCTIIGTGPTAWAGVGLPKFGIYDFDEIAPVGLATIGKGNTFGKELQVVMRFTSCRPDHLDLMAPANPGFSSAGMANRLWVEGSGKPYRSGYGFDDIKVTLDLTKPIQLRSLPTELQLHQGGKSVCSFPRLNVTDIVVVGFKNLSFRLSFAEFPPATAVATTTVTTVTTTTTTSPAPVPTPVPTSVPVRSRPTSAKGKSKSAKDPYAQLAEAGLTPTALLAGLTKLKLAEGK